MKKSVVIWLIVASVLIVAGAALFLSALITVDFDFSQLSSVKMETNTHEVQDSFHSIEIRANTADITFLPSDDHTCKVVCYEKETLRHSVSVENGTLTVQYSDNRKWYDFIGWFTTPKLTVYLPENEYQTLSAETDTGDITLSDFYFESANLSVSTGDIRISSIWCVDDLRVDVSTGKAELIDVSCKNVFSDGDTGDFLMKNVYAEDSFIIERDTGDIRFDTCDAAQILVETDTGDVKGTLLTGKTFVVETDTGEIDVPKDSVGGRCEISTDTGNIRIEILD